jgi:SulP family sulfate permease
LAAPLPPLPPSYSASLRKQLGTISAAHIAKQYATPKAFGVFLLTTAQTIPAVLLGLLINILDGVSYGFIIFPPGPVFMGFGSLGVSMFFIR